jgi:cobaltochelatase CobN
MMGSVVTKYVPVPDRVRVVVGLAMHLARLRHLPNADKRVAILLSSYPTKTARIGNAVGLDSPASLLCLLQALHQAGYDLGAAPLPPDSDSLIQALIASGTYDTEFLTEAQLQGAIGQVPAATYQGWYERWSAPIQSAPCTRARPRRRGAARVPHARGQSQMGAVDAATWL